MKEKTKKIGAAIKRVLGILLCLAVVVGLLPANFAKASGTKASAIDTSKKGSITIHKYEYNGSAAQPGNGKEGQTIPDGATPLEGAGFTIYKVADAAALDTYYAINSTGLPSASDYYETDASGKYKVKDAYAGKKVGDEIKTNSSGEAAFHTLDLGIYLVIETTVPDKVTTPVTPFLVSVPMTTAEGDDWLYDVHVYPKNQTTYGGIALKKTGNDNALLEGVTFVLQKKQADGKYVTVKKNDKGQNVNGTDDTGTLTTGADGVITVADLSQGDYRFIETGIGNNFGYILDGATAYTFTIKSDGKVDYGSTATVDDGSTKYISVNNKKPDVEKKVINSSNTPVKETDYSVRDTISYQVEIKVPENVEKLREFKVQDTPTHIQYKNNTLKVYSNASKATEITAGVSVDNTTPSNGFTVTFNTKTDGGIKAYAGTSIFIFYDAVLQSGASTEKGGNVNTVDLIYDNKIYPSDNTDGNPNPTPMVTPGPGETYDIEDSATVYTFKITVNKTGESNAPLKDVKFDLYKQDDTNGTVTGEDAKALGLDSTKKWTKIETLTTGADGTVSPKDGLANGIYYLVETKTNDGYNLLSKPVKVELKATYTTSFKATSTSDTVTKKSEVDAAASTLTEKMSVDGTDQNTFTVKVKNSKGFTLPQTGGVGGFLFTLIGCIIMIIGIIIFHKTRKKTV